MCLYSFLHNFLAGYLLEDNADKYRFLVNGNITLPGVDDAQEFQQTVKSMKIMGFQDDEIQCKGFYLKKYIFQLSSVLLAHVSFLEIWNLFKRKNQIKRFFRMIVLCKKFVIF